MKGKKIFEVHVRRTVEKFLKETGRSPKLAAIFLKKNQFAIEKQLKEIGFSRNEISDLFHRIFEAINKADAENYYPMAKISEMFNLK